MSLLSPHAIHGLLMLSISTKFVHNSHIYPAAHRLTNCYYRIMCLVVGDDEFVIVQKLSLSLINAINDTVLFQNNYQLYYCC